MFALILLGNDNLQSERESIRLIDKQHEDVAVFRRQFVEKDRSFSVERKRAALRRLTLLERQVSPIPPEDFAVELGRIAALADNGHSGRISRAVGKEICQQFAVLDQGDSHGCGDGSPDMLIPEFRQLPIQFYPFGDSFYVVAAGNADVDLLGARVVSVEGRAIAGMRSLLRSFFGGTAAWRDLQAANVLATPAQLKAVRIARSARALTFRFAPVKGAAIDRTFRTDISDRRTEWTSLPMPDRAPWAFQEKGQPFRWRDAPDIDSLVVQIRTNVDVGNQRVQDFLEDVERRRLALRRSNVVLDLRFNGGGNLMLTREFMTTWPSRIGPNGRIFVLSSRQTFSAAIADIAYLKQAGGDRVVLVGEAPGDRLMFFSEGRPFQLPHSGLFFRASIARMDFRTGCRRYDDCFVGIAQAGHPSAPLTVHTEEVVRRMPVKIRSLEPDVSAPWTITSWLEGTDPAMTAVSRLSRVKSRTVRESETGRE